MSEQFLDIDQSVLHLEWARQPKLYHDKALDLADARLKLDTAKSRHDVIVAEVDREIRETPSAFGISKVTEKVVENAVLMDKRVQNSTAKVNQHKYEVAILSAAVEALDHKKKALEASVQLFLADYFAEPRAPKGARGEVKNMMKSEVRSRGRRDD